MQITWHGQYTIKIVSQDKTLVIDPYSADVGLPAFRAKADIVALSNPGNKNMSSVSGIQGEPFIIDRPGEYTVSSFVLHGLGWHDGSATEHILQRWMIEDMILLHVGALNREMTTAELQELEKTDIDVLFAPIGGGDGLTTAQALKLISTVEPRVVIPIHYKLPKLKEELQDITQFAKEMGVETSTREKKLILKKNKMPQEEMMTVILEA
jgi:L-ascorbate metabolism protein UlaG (beta-lactamase superfamily)